MSRPTIPLVLPLVLAGFAVPVPAQDTLPFRSKVEVYRPEEGDTVVFALRLEQPFLAEEFETSTALRLEPLDDRAYLVYPKETTFRQKHAEFYGRLRPNAEGTARLRLTYETLSETLEGSRRAAENHAEIEVTVPSDPTGAERLYAEWARHQNAHFAELLRWYPEETFLEYVLLQSRARYGVEPPPLPERAPTQDELEEGLYYTFSGGLALQQSLQRRILDTGTSTGDRTIHVSELEPPEIRSLPYEDLLEEKREEGVEPRRHDVASLVPHDRYLLHFRSMDAAEELLDLSERWGRSLFGLLAVRSRDPHLREKLEDQLVVRIDPISRLFADGVVSELAVTGSDSFLAEGTDVSLLFRLERPAIFRKALDGWLAALQERRPDVHRRVFHYRGHEVEARWTTDRVVSSFLVEHEDWLVISNSHRAARTVIDTATGARPSLHEADDYAYLTTVLPPSEDESSAYLYASEAFLRRLVSPEFKISEKRRLQCFNNLVMLNNASLFYRLEHGRSPESLSELVEGDFVDPAKLVCPHGGAYAVDPERDTGTCSLHNRLKYLTPNLELEVLRVSPQEREEYRRYRRRYESFWRNVFDPIALRVATGTDVRLELALLPFANSPAYQWLRAFAGDEPRPLSRADIAPTAVASLVLVPAADRLRQILRSMPGVHEALAAEPTITDLSWLGERVSLHLCDGDTILEVDPTRLRAVRVFGEIPVLPQLAMAGVLFATDLPVYATVDVEDPGKADLLLERLAETLRLRRGEWMQLPTRFDAYRLPEYNDRPVYALGYQLHALKVRLFVARIGPRLVAATQLRTLDAALDAADGEAEGGPQEGQFLLRLDRRAAGELEDDLELYWAEKMRRACHRNILPVQNLVKLYDIPVEEVDRLADAKYGITYYCPDDGEYRYDAETDRVRCTIHGNRQDARQEIAPSATSSFREFLETLDEVDATLRFTDDGIRTVVEIHRSREAP